MKNIILQHWTGPMSELAETSMNAYKNYARRIGCDYHLIEGDAFRRGMKPQMQKLSMLLPDFDEYDYTLMVDGDSLPVKGLEVNVFEEEPGIGLFTDWIKNRAWKRIQITHPFLANPQYPYWGGAFYKLPKDLRVRMRLAIDEQDLITFNERYQDEGVMHRLASLTNVDKKSSYIDPTWSQCSYYPVTKSTKMIHIRPKMEPRDDSPRRPKEETYQDFKQRGIFE